MNSETPFYIVFPSVIEDSQLYAFVSNVLKTSSFDFQVFYKEDIDLASTIFAKLVGPSVGLLIYDGGCFMRIDGAIGSVTKLLTELDTIIGRDITFFVRGSHSKSKHNFKPIKIVSLKRIAVKKKR